MDVGHLPLLARLSGTLCPRTCRIRRLLRTVTGSHWRCFYLRSTSVFSALEVFYENALYKSTFDIWHHALRLPWVEWYCKTCFRMLNKWPNQHSLELMILMLTYSNFCISNRHCANVQYNIYLTRKPSYRWQTRATRKHAKNCSKSTWLQRCQVTIVAYLHWFSCCCVRNLQNHAKYSQNSNL